MEITLKSRRTRIEIALILHWNHKTSRPKRKTPHSCLFKSTSRPLSGEPGKENKTGISKIIYVDRPADRNPRANEPIPAQSPVPLSCEPGKENETGISKTIYAGRPADKNPRANEPIPAQSPVPLSGEPGKENITGISKTIYVGRPIGNPIATNSDK